MNDTVAWQVFDISWKVKRETFSGEKHPQTPTISHGKLIFWMWWWHSPLQAIDTLWERCLHEHSQDQRTRSIYLSFASSGSASDTTDIGSLLRFVENKTSLLHRDAIYSSTLYFASNLIFVNNQLLEKFQLESFIFGNELFDCLLY